MAHFLSPILYAVLLVDQITVIGNKMCDKTSRFANICAQKKTNKKFFQPLKLWVAVARHNFKWLKIQIDQHSMISVSSNLNIIFALCIYFSFYNDLNTVYLCCEKCIHVHLYICNTIYLKSA